MHFVLAVLVWSAFWAVLPVKIVAIAGTVYVLVQTAKQFFPAVCGAHALLLNAALSGAGILSVARPGDLQSPAFWASFVAIVATAAGVHGTVKNLTAAPAPEVATLQAPHAAA